MRKILPFSLLFYGCSLFQATNNSDWSNLNGPTSPQCNPIPAPPRAIGIRNLGMIHHASPADSGAKSGESTSEFLVISTDRTGRTGYHVAPFAGDSGLDPDHFRRLGVEGNSTYVGGTFLGSNPVWAFVEHRVSQDDTIAETGRINFHAATVELPSLQVDHLQHGIKVIPAPDGFWLQMERNGGVDLQFYTLESKDGVKHRRLGETLRVAGDPAVFGGRGGGEARIVTFSTSFEESAGSAAQDAQGSFSLKTSEPAGAPEPAFFELHRSRGNRYLRHTLNFVAETSVESWAAGMDGDLLLLALVDGNSLIGEATLKLAGFSLTDGSVRRLWNLRLATAGAHVGQPAWVSTHTGYVLTYLKWMDADATLETILVDSHGKVKTSRVGAFPKGTTLVEAVASKLGDEFFALLRTRHALQWRFQLCRVPLGV